MASSATTRKRPRPRREVMSDADLQMHKSELKRLEDEMLQEQRETDPDQSCWMCVEYPEDKQPAEAVPGVRNKFMILGDRVQLVGTRVVDAPSPPPSTSTRISRKKRKRRAAWRKVDGRPRHAANTYFIGKQCTDKVPACWTCAKKWRSDKQRSLLPKKVTKRLECPNGCGRMVTDYVKSRVNITGWRRKRYFEVLDEIWAATPCQKAFTTGDWCRFGQMCKYSHRATDGSLVQQHFPAEKPWARYRHYVEVHVDPNSRDSDDFALSDSDSDSDDSSDWEPVVTFVTEGEGRDVLQDQISVTGIHADGEDSQGRPISPIVPLRGSETESEAGSEAGCCSDSESGSQPGSDSDLGSCPGSALGSESESESGSEAESRLGDILESNLMAAVGSDSDSDWDPVTSVVAPRGRRVGQLPELTSSAPGEISSKPARAEQMTSPPVALQVALPAARVSRPVGRRVSRAAGRRGAPGSLRVRHPTIWWSRRRQDEPPS